MTDTLNPTGHPRLDWAMFQLYNEVHQERIRAHLKHISNSREDASWTNAEWLPILMEELGEVAHLLTYDAWPPAGSTQSRELRKELIQVAAMACAWVAAIDEAGADVA